MPIYIRTTAGRAAALNPLSMLPRSMRTLLTVIDGQTDSSVYITRLPSIGNVQSLLDSLENSGFIQIAYQKPVIPAAAPSSYANATPIEDATKRAAGWSDTHAGDLEPLKSPPAVPSLAPRSKYVEPYIAAATIDELSSIASAQQQPAPVQAKVVPETIAPSLVPNNNAANSSQYKLRSAVLLISDFVTAHMHNESIEIILTLEGLETTEHLVASLPGYAALIAPLGQPAREHLSQLRAMLV